MNISKPLLCGLALAVIAITGLAKEPAGKIKNVLLIMSDDLKASALAAYGNTVCQTPNIDRLAKSGMVFERAYCQGLACSPSRPSMLRSIYPKSKATAPTIGEHLQKHGMHTARVGKIFHMPVPHAQLDGSDGRDVAECWTERYNTKSAETFSPGLYRLLNSDIVTRKIEGRDAKGRNRMWATVGTDKEDGSDQADHMVATKAVELLRERKKAGKPFFLGVGFVRPHFPMVQPKKFFNLYPQEKMKIPPQIAGDLDDIPSAGRGPDGKGLNEMEESRRRMWQAYYGSVTFMDEQLGKVLDELERLGLRDSTAIVFTTDHGYHLGEHGFWQKGNLHEEVVRVPLIISAPGIRPGRTSSLVELVDLYPTWTDLLQLPAPKGLHGKSLTSILHDPNAKVRDTALSIHNRAGGGLRSVRWHYMSYGQKGEELYDMIKDPDQYTNVVSDSKYAAILKKARAQFKDRMAAAK
ncbi:MAG: sulfatase [Verrucomicrobiota bacterium]|nr:sulfatase [Verrucomicrobiota bacterium]